MESKAKRLTLNRCDELSNDQVTIGKLLDGDKLVCYTLELPWRENAKNVSCIPTGLYEVIPHESPKFGECFLVNDVPGRSAILFHAGNTTSDTKGCILVGDSLGMNLKSVHHSRITLRNLLQDYFNGFELQITNSSGLQC